MNLPTVSIIIPCFNSEKTINACLSSLRIQDFESWEAICVDDGSTDRTLFFLERIARQDSRIKFFSQGNLGAALARSKGISLAQGEFITFLDSDDTLERNYLSKMLREFSSDIDIVVTGLNIIYDGKKKVFRQYYKTTLDGISFLKSVLCGKYGWELCGKMYRSDLFKTVLYTPKVSISVGEDALYFFQILTKVNRVTIIESSLYNYYQRSSSISKIHSDKLAIETLRAAIYIERLLKREVFYSQILNEIDAMYLLFYSNATRRTKIGWFNPFVKSVCSEHLSVNALFLIPKIKALYVLFSFILGILFSKLRVIGRGVINE